MNLSELRAVAEAARTEQIDEGWYIPESDALLGVELEADRAYIAAVDPRTILALIDVCEAAKEWVAASADLPLEEWSDGSLALRAALERIEQ